MKRSDPFLRRLTDLAPPPPQPSFLGSVSGFKTIERELGITFPASYKELIRFYGYGLWFDLFCILDPFIGDGKAIKSWHCPRYGLTGGPAWCEMMRASREQYAWAHPYAIYPEPGGAFPWAFTDQGGVVYWLMEGKPDAWKSVHKCDGLQDWKTDLSITEILFSLASRDSTFCNGDWQSWFKNGVPPVFKPHKLVLPDTPVGKFLIACRNDLAAADVLMNSGQATEGIKALKVVLARMQKRRKSDIAELLHYTCGALGNAYFRAGDTAKAIEFTRKAKSLSEEFGDSEKASLYDRNLRYMGSFGNKPKTGTQLLD